MGNRIQELLSYVVTVVAAVLAVVLVHREFYASPRDASRQTAAQLVADWNSLQRVGISSGDTNAPVQVIVFSDLECPVCRQFDQTLRELRQKHGSRVASVFVHYPLSMHRFARPAARAAECADHVGRFDEFVSATYSKQDSLGLRPWSAYARDAGIQDTIRFAKCNSDTVSVSRIEAGLAAGTRLKIRGTPTVLINGWQLPNPPDGEELERIVAALLSGEKPFTGQRR